MIERFFYETLSEELTKRGFFVATEHAPENCVGICGINGTEKRVKYVEYLQENYRLAAIKNFIFSIENDGKEVTRYIVECIKCMTSSLMDVLREWISEGKFPLHRFAEGSEDIIKEDLL